MQHSAHGIAPLRQYSEEPISLHSQVVFSVSYLSEKYPLRQLLT